MKYPGFSLILVIAQFVLIALMLSPITDFLSTRSSSLIGVLLIMDGVCVAAWAFFSMQRGTFRVMPEPASTAQLTQAGPYKWLRHPMYFAVLLAGLGAAISHATLWHAGVLFALTAVLLVKLHREEQYLLATFEGYADYKSTTKAIVPFIY